jgi:hypothetical protein
MLSTSSTIWCGLSQGAHGSCEVNNSFCADSHERLASILRNTVGPGPDCRGTVGHALFVTEFGKLFGWEDVFAEEAGSSLLRCRRWRRTRTVPHFILFEIVSGDGSIMGIVGGW